MTVLETILGLFVRGARQVSMHKVSSAIVALLLLVLAFMISERLVAPDSVQASGRGANIQPTSTMSYFKGQQDFDSQLIWTSLSPELISQAEAAGATIDDLQDQLDEARELGRTLEQVAYIGGYDLRGGGSMQFYVATVKSTSLSEEVEEIFYVFTLDEEGKISKIE